MYILILFVHILVCFGLMVSILLQSGKGGSLAGAFGAGGGSQTLFGSRGASTFLTRATQWLGVVFFATSLSLALISKGTNVAPKSLLKQEAQHRGTAPSTPAPTPPAGR
jgi:preprotein translocase subunit SecG